jgi:hypothetical protein
MAAANTSSTKSGDQSQAFGSTPPNPWSLTNPWSQLFPWLDAGRWSGTTVEEAAKIPRSAFGQAFPWMAFPWVDPRAWSTPMAQDNVAAAPDAFAQLFPWMDPRLWSGLAPKLAAWQGKSTLAYPWLGGFASGSGTATPPSSAPAMTAPLFAAPQSSMGELYRQLREYWIDSAQRTILYWDVMRKRGNLYLEHGLQGKPPLLKFKYEVVMDGATLERPCNYCLLRILPNADQPVDASKRPIIIVDPRAGHGPGIGGFKPDSQVGVALRAGHPVYFVSFAPRPIPGQRLTDVALAEAKFIEKVHELHPGGDKKPAIIGNCQAGWAVAALACVRPEIMGPILLNGAPLSYWAGSREQNPMRYTGGLYGGGWPAALTSDLGGGEFDGAHLVTNFENLNPGNTYWTKPYSLYANIDTEEPRFLEFERWWTGYFRLTGEEMEAIVNNLFVGNKLARGTITSDQGRIDLHNITSPVVVFASFGDNITPPQQALDWIIDAWGDERAIIEAGRIICYTLHEDIGHLGIFVGGGVARKQHDQLVNALDQIEILPPGLYEIIIERKSGPVAYEELTHGQYEVRFEPRTMNDLRKIEPDGRSDERIFSTIAKVSEINSAAYERFVRPWVRAMVWPPFAQAMISMSPNRLERVLLSDINPVMRIMASLAGEVGAARQPVAEDNVFKQLERDNGDAFRRLLDGYRDGRDYWVARYVEWLYGPFMLGAVFPPDLADEERARQVAAEKLAAASRTLEAKLDQGGFPAGLVRMLFIALREEGGIHRRSVMLAQMAGRVANELIENGRIAGVTGPVDWATIRREQASLLALFPERAVEALPKLLANPRERELATAMVAKITMRDPASADPQSDLARRAQEVLGITFEQAAAKDDLPPEFSLIRFLEAA